jgi:hypothetical protein
MSMPDHRNAFSIFSRALITQEGRLIQIAMKTAMAERVDLMGFSLPLRFKS